MTDPPLSPEFCTALGLRSWYNRLTGQTVRPSAPPSTAVLSLILGLTQPDDDIERPAWTRALGSPHFLLSLRHILTELGLPASLTLSTRGVIPFRDWDAPTPSGLVICFNEEWWYLRCNDPELDWRAFNTVPVLWTDETLIQFLNLALALRSRHD